MTPPAMDLKPLQLTLSLQQVPISIMYITLVDPQISQLQPLLLSYIIHQDSIGPIMSQQVEQVGIGMYLRS